MEKIKCGQCGLVNWQGATTCGRCNGSLAVGVNPFENGTATKGGVNPLVIGFAALMLAGIGYGLYQVMAPTAEPAKAQTENLVIDQQKIQQMVFEAQKKDAERLAQMQTQWKSLEAPKFDKKLMQKSAEQWRPKAQHFPAVPPGGFGPPGAGVPYHTR